eukprot:3940292-Rhodomonas_salina.4
MKVLLGRVLLGKVLLGKVLLGDVLLGKVLLGKVLLGKVLFTFSDVLPSHGALAYIAAVLEQKPYALSHSTTQKKRRKKTRAQYRTLHSRCVGGYRIVAWCIA